MFYNYLKVALRNFGKQKFYSAINIFGLAIGVCCCLLILLYVRDELSYDQYHEKIDRLYRINAEINFGGSHTIYSVAPAPMAAALVNEFPEVEQSFRFRNWGSFLVRREGEMENVREESFTFADPGFFDIFSIPLLAGNKETVLTEPNTTAISSSIAKKYFGDENPIGQTLILDDETSYKVTGVFADIPDNTHFQFGFLLAMEGLEDSKNQVWLSNNYYTYLVLKEGVKPEVLESKFPALFKKYGGPQIMQILDVTLEDIEKSGQGVWYHLQAVKDIHLYSDLVPELANNGDISYVYIFSSIALFILFIACINFMNLATARSSNRAREVGVRKVLGSFRQNLIRQFLVESIAISMSAFVLAVILAEIFLPGFNALVGKSLHISVFNPVFIGSILLASIALGILAGIYPAFYLSSFNPVEVLKGRLRTGIKSGQLRNALVVFQFVVSIFLIIGTLVINKQLNFIKNKKLGFDKEHVLMIRAPYALQNQLLSFKEQILQFPEVDNATVSSFLPVNSSRSNLVMWPEGPFTEDNSVSMQFWNVDHDYIKTMGMEIEEGRDFDIDLATDSMGIILNERAALQFGFDNPVGQRVNTFDGPPGPEGRGFKTFAVLGVVKDFHFESLRQSVSPLGMVIGSSRGYMSIRYQTDQPGAFISKIEGLWKGMAPGQPFVYNFLDSRFSSMYDAEQRTSKIFLLFAGLAIFVACLGLFALATFTAEKRTKEIGIRKVMGASGSNIFILLSSEFSKWVILAYVLAFPLSWYFANKWLQDFTYQASLGWNTFATAAVIAFGIALVTVSFQSARAALANPIESLRYE